MPRYFIKLAYNGKNYHGWQVQENAHSVQAEITAKFAILFKKNIELTGCGRTDTGVHASMYFAHFDISETINEGKTVFQLNALLPADIAVYKIFKVEPNLHARFDAVYREYRYELSTVKTPFYQDLSWVFTRKLNINLMNEAATILLSHTNFECFSKVHTQVATFNCKVSKAGWQWVEPNKLVFTIGADRFLRNMVRAIVGTLIDVGSNKISLDEFKDILNSNNRSMAGQSVPAHGLYLQKVIYPTINDEN